MRIIFLALLLLFSFTTIQAAPAPPEKPLRYITQVELVGSWKYKYGANEGVFTFFPWGYFENNLGVGKYQGTWTLNDKGEITILEKGVYTAWDGGISYGHETKFVFKFPPCRARKGDIKTLKGDSYNGGSNVPFTTVSLGK